jgi:hypothetical protein
MSFTVNQQVVLSTDLYWETAGTPTQALTPGRSVFTVTSVSGDTVTVTSTPAPEGQFVPNAAGGLSWVSGVLQFPAELLVAYPGGLV